MGTDVNVLRKMFLYVTNIESKLTDWKLDNSSMSATPNNLAPNSTFAMETNEDGIKNLYLVSSLGVIVFVVSLASMLVSRSKPMATLCLNAR